MPRKEWGPLRPVVETPEGIGHTLPEGPVAPARELRTGGLETATVPDDGSRGEGSSEPRVPRSAPMRSSYSKSGKTMFPSVLTPKEQAFLDNAREWYEKLRAGKGTPLNQVPHIREQLANAGVEADSLDPTGERTAAQIDRELDQAYARAKQQLQDTWRDLAARSRTGPKPDRSSR